MSSIPILDGPFAWTCLWQSSLFLLAGLLASRLLTRHAAQAHCVLALAIGGAIAAPILTLAASRVGLGLFVRVQVGEPVVVRPAPDLDADSEHELLESPFVPDSPSELAGLAPQSGTSDSGAAGSEFSRPAGPSREAGIQQITGSPADRARPPVSQARREEVESVSLEAWFVLFWGASSLILLTRLAIGMLAGQRLVTTARPVENEQILRTARLACAHLGLRADPIILQSRRVRCPSLWGWRRRPVLLLPESWPQDRSETRTIGVFCHELGHWLRRDHWTHLLADLAICAIPWQPLTCIAAARLRQFSERACDDWVLSSGVSPTNYADILISLIPQDKPSRTLAAVSSRKALVERIRHILRDGATEPRLAGRWRSLATAATVGILVLTALAQSREAPAPATATSSNEIAGEVPKSAFEPLAIRSSDSIDAWDQPLPKEVSRALRNSADILKVEQQKLEAQTGLTEAEKRQGYADAHLIAAGPLREAHSLNPGDSVLAIKLAMYLERANQMEEARYVLETAIRENPDSYAIRSNYASALGGLAQEMKDAGSEDRLRINAEGLRYIDEAIRLEPIAFESYPIKARLLEQKFDLDGSWELERAGKMREVLEIFVQAYAMSQQLDLRREVPPESQREQMILAGFSIARGYVARYPAPETRDVALEYARRFAGFMRSSYPALEHAPAMEGWLAVADGDETRAIRLYQESDKIATSDSFLSRLVKQELVRLLSDSAPGAALQYAEEAIVSLGDQPPPRSLAFQKLKLLVSLNRLVEAMDFITELERTMTDDRELLLVKARVMQALKARGASEVLDSLADASEILVEKARLAALGKDYENAVALLTPYLKDHPNDLNVLRLYALVIVRLDRRLEGLNLVDTMIEAAREESKIKLRTYRVLIGEPDAVKRDEKLLAILQSIPDECQRASELLTYYVQREKLEPAMAQLGVLEECRGSDDPQVMQIAFSIAVNRKDLAAAGQYAAKLSSTNADGAGGATYRGQLAMARGEFDEALREYRMAEQDLPMDVRVKVRVAHLLVRADPPQLEQAVMILEAGIAIAPRDLELNKLMFACYEARGRTSAGLRYLMTAAEVNPNDGFVKERRPLIEEARDPKAGVAWREELRRKQPDDLENLVKLAGLYERLTLREIADECMADAIAAAPRSRLVAQAFVEIHGRRTSFDSAIDAAQRKVGEEFLRKYIDASSGAERLVGLLLLGRFYSLRRDPATDTAYLDAERFAEELLNNDPEQLWRAKQMIAAERGNVHMVQGRYADAGNAYREALGHTPVPERTLARELRLSLIRALLADRQTGSATEALDSYDKDCPDDPRARQLRLELHRLLAETTAGRPARYITYRRESKAINDEPALRLAIQYHPNNVAALVRLADHCAGNSRETEALELYRRVLELTTDDPENELRKRAAAAIERMN